VAVRLVTDGWTVCGVEDWATVWRSPDGLPAARVCPFELAYEVFVARCRDLTGHRLLPRVDFYAALPGGGRLTVMEFLHPAEEPRSTAVLKRWSAGRLGRWSAGAPGDPIDAIRAEAERLSESWQLARSHSAAGSISALATRGSTWRESPGWSTCSAQPVRGPRFAPGQPSGVRRPDPR
jgi:hypothetical protein